MHALVCASFCFALPCTTAAMMVLLFFLQDCMQHDMTPPKQPPLFSPSYSPSLTPSSRAFVTAATTWTRVSGLLLGLLLDVTDARPPPNARQVPVTMAYPVACVLHLLVLVPTIHLAPATGFDDAWSAEVCHVKEPFGH
ncbi:uncharacterized protein K460DRAFT_360453 [Cucurbitaria berberidis CBS 394.84]|uniref:Secreted protein n=1 Tax=Cucurbitaria berberidis CBS 394.84 TaxID=1168544 RepID=A0A9P4LBH2_9PLEO|nr:uncharacterized protein K460DRAFT_360453 [Cucurbitaria berberidis CBS 394.84]KAF1849591.1 hypothetical protein K460DRAFT_360453 [Cucurbitaria berberidis CBS 394.84]